MVNNSEKAFEVIVKNIVIVGAGVVGGTNAAVFASHLNNIDVTVFDTNSKKIQAWYSNELPVFEPNLRELVMRHRSDMNKHTNNPRSNSMEVVDGYSKNLYFCSDASTALQKADMIFVCVSTPQKARSDKFESLPDTAALQSAIHKIGEVMKQDFIVVIKSTSFPHATWNIGQSLRKTVHRGIRFEVLSSPEYLAAGTAIEDLETPDRVIIGSTKTVSGRRASHILSEIYARWIPREKIITSDQFSTELSKLCANAFLAQRVSSINSISMICEKAGGDVSEMKKIIGSDKRIGEFMLSASAGFGGSCFQKDIAHLVYFARDLGLPDVAKYWKAVLTMNDTRKVTFTNRVFNRLAAIKAKRYEQFIDEPLRVAVLGFAFKAGTNDGRNSPAIDLVRRLSRQHDVAVFDLCISEAEICAFLGLDSKMPYRYSNGSISYCTDMYAACRSASAICIVTDWSRFGTSMPAFRTAFSHTSPTETWTDPVDWSLIARTMMHPKIVFDGVNVIDAGVAGHGFQVEGVGRKLQGPRSSSL